jgi:uncharacterized membrane protein
MRKERFETFTDGVVAIIITLMVLEIKLPELTADNFLLLMRHIAVYALSFIVVAILWLNHHKMFLQTEQVNTKIIWFNFALLFSCHWFLWQQGHWANIFFKGKAICKSST